MRCLPLKQPLLAGNRVAQTLLMGPVPLRGLHKDSTCTSGAFVVPSELFSLPLGSFLCNPFFLLPLDYPRESSWDCQCEVTFPTLGVISPEEGALPRIDWHGNLNPEDGPKAGRWGSWAFAQSFLTRRVQRTEPYPPSSPKSIAIAFKMHSREVNLLKMCWVP